MNVKKNHFGVMYPTISQCKKKYFLAGSKAKFYTVLKITTRPLTIYAD